MSLTSLLKQMEATGVANVAIIKVHYAVALPKMKSIALSSF